MYTLRVAGRKAEDEQKRAVAQSGSALAWGARGRGFESRLPEKQRRLDRKVGPFLLPSKRGFETTTPQGLWAWKRSALPCPLAAETPLGGYPCDKQGRGGWPQRGNPACPRNREGSVARLGLFCCRASEDSRPRPRRGCGHGSAALLCPLAAETLLGGYPCDSKGEGGGHNGESPLPYGFSMLGQA